MVRLMLVLAPVMCILSGIGISAVLTTYMKNLEAAKDKKAKKMEDNYPKKAEVIFFQFLVEKLFQKFNFLMINYKKTK